MSDVLVKADEHRHPSMSLLRQKATFQTHILTRKRWYSRIRIDGGRFMSEMRVMAVAIAFVLLGTAARADEQWNCTVVLDPPDHKPITTHPQYRVVGAEFFLVNGIHGAVGTPRYRVLVDSEYVLMVTNFNSWHSPTGSKSSSSHTIAIDKRRGRLVESTIIVDTNETSAGVDGPYVSMGTCSKAR